MGGVRCSHNLLMSRLMCVFLSLLQRMLEVDNGFDDQSLDPTDGLPCAPSYGQIQSSTLAELDSGTCQLDSPSALVSVQEVMPRTLAVSQPGPVSSPPSASRQSAIPTHDHLWTFSLPQEAEVCVCRYNICNTHIVYLVDYLV